MQTTDAILRAGIERGADLALTLDPAFQGLPDTAHGGSVLAVFDALAGRPGPRRITGLYRRRVPLGTRLRLDVAPTAHGAAGRLLDRADAILVEGAVSALVAGASHEGGGADTTIGQKGDAVRGGHGERPLPVSSTCFACGVDNPLGLRVQLAFDDVAVRGAWLPPARFRSPDGRLAPVALTTLLDEAAFWLGALASGEAGMTTELAVTLLGDADAGAAVTVAGRRDVVRARPDDARYWDTDVTAFGADGRALARAGITFVAVRGSAKKLVNGLLKMNRPDVLRGVFPAYVG